MCIRDRKCGEGETLLLHVETEEELVDKVPICMTAEEMIGKPTVFVGEKL